MKVSDHPNSYLLMFEGVEVYNNAPELYVKRDHLRIGVSGFDSPDIQKFYKGELNTIADVYRNNPGDSPYYILPKSGWIWGRNGNESDLSEQKGVYRWLPNKSSR